MELSIDPNRAHRLAKMYMDTGEARSYKEAQRILSGYRLAIVVGSSVAESPTLQASLLTAINTGRRCFLGGVEVAGLLDVPLRLAWPRSGTLADAVTYLEGKWVEAVTPQIPRILVGNIPKQDQIGSFCIRTTCDGWKGGVVPLDDAQSPPLTAEFTPAGVLSGAIAVSEAFQHVRGGSAYAGRRALGLSLWEPGQDGSWLDCQAGPALRFLPAKAWLIGLGHLGQAFLWTLGFLPYTHPEEVDLVLQDIDELSEANDSTSLLTNMPMVGSKKTRAMASWCDAMGFRSRIVERAFANDFHLASDEPHVGICGVDNQQARAALEDVGFDRIFEAGLGAGADDFLCFQTHSFPATRKARDIWKAMNQTSHQVDLTNLPPAYQSNDPYSVEACGLIQLAGRSVGSAFVGAITSTLVLADLLRMTMGETQYEFIDGDLRTGNIKAIPNHHLSTINNPGFTMV